MPERLTVWMEAEDAPDVVRARSGDDAAFGRLVARHSPHVFRLAFRMVGNEHDAEDAVQEAFLKAYRALPEFESRSRFSSWLHRITVNCAYDVLRRRARRAEDPLESPVDEDAAAPELPSTEPLPDRLAQGQQLRRRLKVALARLSDLERPSSPCATRKACPCARSGTPWAWTRTPPSMPSSARCGRCAK